MGFETERTFDLNFEGTEWDGAEVKLRSASIGTLRALFASKDVDVEMQVLADHLIEWNLTKNGEPIPATFEGIQTLEEPAKDLIVKHWLRATRGITAPLDKQSKDGDTLEAPPITMETL